MSQTTNTKDPKLNLAGRLANSFLYSKITALIMIAITLFGLMAVLITPRLYNPEIVVPGAQIFVQRPGNDAAQIEDQVVKPLEALMARLKGVEHTYGVAMDDFGMVTVQFEVGSDEEASLLRLYNEISRNLDRLPPNTSMPLVKSIGITDVPIMSLTLSSEALDSTQLREVGQRLLEQVQNVPEVGASEVIGGHRRVLAIDVDPQRLAATGVPMSRLSEMLQGANVVLPGGALTNDNQEIRLRTDAAFTGPEDLENLVIGQHEQRPIYLAQVADITYTPEENDQYTTHAFGPANTLGKAAGDPTAAVTVTVGKRAGANAVTVAAAVKEKLEIIERELLPEQVDLTITRDYGDRADDAVNTLIEHLGVAVLVVLIILFFFLGWREALIVTLTVPLTLFVVLGVGWIFGQTINRISLFGLILSLGLLVDAAIVVIENIHRHLHEGKEPSFADLLVRATNEVGNPTNIATLAVILAFVPMAFVSGMMGPFMLPIPINVSVAMIASLILAYIIVPWTAYRWLGSKARKALAKRDTLEGDPHHEDWLMRNYKRVAKPLLGSRGFSLAFLLLVLGLMIASMLMPAWQFVRDSGMNGPLSPAGVSLKMLPEGNVDTFLLEVNTPEGTAVERTSLVADAVGRVVSQNRYVTDYQTYVGRTGPLTFAGMVRGDMMRQAPNMAQIRVNLVDRHHRPVTSEVAMEMWEQLESVRERHADSDIKLFLTPPGPPVRAQVLARIHGPDYETLREIATQVRGRFEDVYGMINVDDSITADAPEYRIEVNQTKALQSGIAPAQIAKVVHEYVNGQTLGTVHDTDTSEPVNIVLRLDQANRAWIRQIRDLTVTNPEGKAVKIGNLVDIREGTVTKPIMDRDQHPVVFVQGDLLGSSPVYATLTLNKWLNEMELDGNVEISTGNLGFVDSQPDDLEGYQVLWGGDMRLTLDVFRDLGAAFIVALVFIYLLLVAYYQSFMLPVIVMGAIPLTLVGIFPGHWLFDMPFNATSMIGFIALAGIVVRNSLLLIDFILDYRQQGYGLKESVLEAGAVRFRPILLTALAIMFGSAIMITDPVFGGLAVSLIFGTFASTMLTLLVIPIMYYFWQLDQQIKTEKKATKAKAT
ncbi:efflux RND transporter permease subunit [Guyparkeria hydrothermalis]|uniref:efflux RND transporter permease subunit n=1 Tax=Guyparkeria TaxID=2035712 RepID=UPI0010AB9C98|nr:MULTISPECIES: efflux RND transporter permease subunit [Guyparkeria]MCL7751249.1 efflux RND transporter permease subunit [Guyparkeria hydrothermalis]TKA89605.1 efflux RND transporter permease subunit [Guyparkeria sp. SB14A]